MFLRCALLLFSFLTYSFLGLGQSRIDSLTNILESASGIDRVDALNALSWDLKFSNLDTCFILIKESIALAKESKFLEGEAQAQYQLASFYYLVGDYPQSLQTADVSSSIFKKSNNAGGVVKNLNLKGLVLNKRGDLSEAMDYYEKALVISKSLEDEYLTLTVQSNIASIAFDKGDYKKSIQVNEVLSDKWLAIGDTSAYYLVIKALGVAIEDSVITQRPYPCILR